MPRIISNGRKFAPRGARFTCPESGSTYETDGNEPLEEFEVSAHIGHQTNSVNGIRCPGCNSGVITFSSDRDGESGSHDYAQ